MSDVPPSKDTTEEEDTQQQQGDVDKREMQSENTQVSASDEYKQGETDKVEPPEGSPSSSAATNRETKDDIGEDMEQAGVKRNKHTGEKKDPKTTTPPTPDDEMDEQGDGPNLRLNEETPVNNCTNTEAAEGQYHSGEKKAPKTPTPLTLDDGKDDQGDGPDLRLSEETPGDNSTNTEAGEDDGSDLLPSQENTSSAKTALSTEIIDQRNVETETIGPTTQETTEPTVSEVTGSPGGSSRFLIAVGIVVAVVVAILVQHLHQPESPPQKDNVQQIDIFLTQMDKLKSKFPNQRTELWKRSKIHLLRHLQTAQPTEPVSLILTAGIRAEKTLRCLAQGLASAFSTSLNASVLHIDGTSKASQDSDQVKLDIDSKLQGAFEGDKPVAVIHRFEELPPGSTLIFYRYCDHENAAYKKTFLIFTVLLGEEEEIPAKSRLSTVEEMVDDHLQKKFLSDGHPISFDRMDLDKYGGLWSRISHLILPVAAEKRMEHEGC